MMMMMMFSVALYYCNSTFLSKLDDRKFRKREKKKEIKHHILQQVHEMKIHYELHTLSFFRQSALSRWNAFLFHTLSLSPPSGTYVASHKLFVTEATQCQKSLHSLHLL